MKIRKGFVSNSSSSSFIVEGSATIAQVALAMMYEIRSDWESSNYDSWDPPKRFYEALKWVSENQNYDKPLLIPWSTNEETFIWRANDGIMVKTCNNHDWGLVGATYIDDEDRFYEEVKLEIFLDLEDMSHKTKKQFWDEQMAKWGSEAQET